MVSLARFLLNQLAPYRPASITIIQLAAGRPVLRVEYGAPSPLELLGKALEINPNYAEAHGVAAQCYMRRVWTALDLSADLASALAHTRAIMSIKTDDASTLAFAAGAYARGKRDYETAIQMIEHALAHRSEGRRRSDCECER